MQYFYPPEKWSLLKLVVLAVIDHAGDGQIISAQDAASVAGKLFAL